MGAHPRRGDPRGVRRPCAIGDGASGREACRIDRCRVHPRGVHRPNARRGDGLDAARVHQRRQRVDHPVGGDAEALDRTGVQRRRPPPGRAVTITREQTLAVLPAPVLFIGGDFVAPADLEPSTHIDPATGEPTGAYLAGRPQEVDAAVAAARQALPGWQTIAPSARRALLLRLADLIEASAEELGALMALQMGQPVRAAAAGDGHAAEWVRYYAGWADKLVGSVAPVAPGRVLDYVVPEPYGVVAAIIPWNGPVSSLALKLAPALAAGQ